MKFVHRPVVEIQRTSTQCEVEQGEAQGVVCGAGFRFSEARLHVVDVVLADAQTGQLELRTVEP